MVKRAKPTVVSFTDPWWPSAVQYLARGDRTSVQVERFLKAKGASALQARRIIRRLVNLRYLDDGAFADRLVEARLARRPLGREGLRLELLAKGISQVLADQALDKALSDLDEETLARRALNIRQRGGRRLSPLQISRLLRRWGFEAETVERIIGERQDVES